MVDSDTGKDPDKLSVALNDAFERLEKQQQENLRTDATTKSGAAPPAPERSKPIEPSKKSSPLVALALLLALIAICVAGYAVYLLMTGTANTLNLSGSGTTQTTTQTQSTAQTAALEGRLARVEGSLQSVSGVEDLRARLDQVTLDLAGFEPLTRDDLAEVTKTVDGRIAAVEATISTSRQDWLFAEVEYLLRLASQRVAMEGDARGALSLFKTADEIIRDAEGIAAFELRKSMANDMTRLAAVADLDVDGIFVRLAALSGRVDDLHQKQQKFVLRGPAAPSAETPVATGIGNRIVAFAERAFDRLTSLVDYRKDSDEISPMLPPKEEYYLRQNLILKLEMAQLGLLRHDQPVYAGSVADARDWVSRYFDGDDAATKAMVAALTELGAINVAQERPDVSGSLREVRKLLSRFNEAGSRSPEK